MRVVSDASSNATRDKHDTGAGGSAVGDTTSERCGDAGRNDCDEDTDSCLSSRRVTQPAQQPGSDGRSD